MTVDVSVKPRPKRSSNQAEQDRPGCQNDERNRHYLRAFVRFDCCRSRRAKENVANLASHIKCREQRTECSEIEWPRRMQSPYPGAMQDFILAPKTGEEQWNA